MNALVPSEVIGAVVPLTKRGTSHMGLCPFHKEYKPSFSVDDANGYYHCFGCGAHGDLITFVMRMSGASFPDAVELLGALLDLQRAA